jgi:hypothetical protein
MRRVIPLVAFLLLAALALGAGAYSIDRSVIGCGGGSGSGTSYSVLGTAGQSAVGTTSGGSYLKEIGFWYTPGWLLTGVPESAPLAFKLGQNTPNPFNPVTKISYSVPARSRVSLVLYSVDGRVVRTLVDEEKEPGVHRVTLNAAGLASGVYFCRMVSGGFVQTRKMVLLK